MIHARLSQNPNVQCIFVDVRPQESNMGGEIEIPRAVRIIIWQLRCAAVLYPHFVPLVLESFQVRLSTGLVPQQHNSLSRGISRNRTEYLFQGCPVGSFTIPRASLDNGRCVSSELFEIFRPCETMSSANDLSIGT